MCTVMDYTAHASFKSLLTDSMEMTRNQWLEGRKNIFKHLKHSSIYVYVFGSKWVKTNGSKPVYDCAVK